MISYFTLAEKLQARGIKVGAVALAHLAKPTENIVLAQSFRAASFRRMGLYIVKFELGKRYERVPIEYAGRTPEEALRRAVLDLERSFKSIPYETRRYKQPNLQFWQ